MGKDLHKGSVVDYTNVKGIKRIAVLAISLVALALLIPAPAVAASTISWEMPGEVPSMILDDGYAIAHLYRSGDLDEPVGIRYAILGCSNGTSAGSGPGQFEVLYSDDISFAAGEDYGPVCTVFHPSDSVYGRQEFTLRLTVTSGDASFDNGDTRTFYVDYGSAPTSAPAAGDSYKPAPPGGEGAAVPGTVLTPTSGASITGGSGVTATPVPGTIVWIIVGTLSGLAIIGGAVYILVLRK